ncbi:hypothetical protein [Ruegeria sp. HKCCD8929]|nr:hypothetical protein [Ruegeria sp. HKCCD8929]
MTPFAKTIILTSAIIVVLGWLVGGGSVESDAAQTGSQYQMIRV